MHRFIPGLLCVSVGEGGLANSISHLEVVPTAQIHTPKCIPPQHAHTLIPIIHDNRF